MQAKVDDRDYRCARELFLQFCLRKQGRSFSWFSKIGTILMVFFVVVFFLATFLKIEIQSIPLPLRIASVVLFILFIVCFLFAGFCEHYIKRSFAKEFPRENALLSDEVKTALFDQSIKKIPGFWLTKP